MNKEAVAKARETAQDDIDHDVLVDLRDTSLAGTTSQV